MTAQHRLAQLPPWRNRLARSAVNRKVGGSSPPGGVRFYVFVRCCFFRNLLIISLNVCIHKDKLPKTRFFVACVSDTLSASEADAVEVKAMYCSQNVSSCMRSKPISYMLLRYDKTALQHSTSFSLTSTVRASTCLLGTNGY